MFEWSQDAARERALAIDLFLRDVYSHAQPNIFSVYPRLKFCLESNPYFLKRLVGNSRAAAPWNIEVAFDWTIRRRNGMLCPVVIESDTCAIGGLLTCAIIYQHMRSLWHDSLNLSRFEDGSEYLQDLLVVLADIAEKASGIPLLYTERCLKQYFVNPQHSWLRDQFAIHGFKVAGPWNRRQIRLDKRKRRYRFAGKLVSLVFLHYYPCCFDLNYPEYCRVPQYLRTPSEMRHAVNGFWTAYHSGSKRAWSQTNPLGAEVMCDKATSAFLPDIVRHYLGCEPIIGSSDYLCFFNDDGKLDPLVVDRVFDNPKEWVVKSRRDSGQGYGVIRAEDCAAHAWHTLRSTVMKRPLDFVAQPIIDDEQFDFPDREVRTIEFRNIVHTLESNAFQVNQVFCRAARVGKPRNLSSNLNCQMIPLLVPRSRK